MKPCWLLGFTLLLSGCSGEAEFSHAAAQPINVSMYRLIANPQEFDGRRVTVVGYVLRTDFETSVVAVTEQDAFRFIGDNWVRLDAESCTYQNGKELAEGYAQISGVFSAADGPEDRYPGTIERVVSCKAWTICRDDPNCIY